MKKKYLFLFLFLPLLSLGQDTTYYVKDGLLMKSTKETLGKVPSYLESSAIYSFTVTPSGLYSFSMQGKDERGDSKVGFLLIHDLTVQKTYINNHGAVSLIHTEVVMDEPKIGSTLFFALGYLLIFGIGFIYDDRKEMLTRWLAAKKILFPFWQIMMRVASLFIYWMLIPLLIRAYGAGAPTMFFGMTMPWVIVTAFTVISFTSLIMKYVLTGIDFRYKMQTKAV